MSASSFYLRLRSGKAFIVGLIAFCLVWWGWNLVPWLPHFDPTLALLMMILSVEASTNGAIITDQNMRAQDAQRQQDAREERQLRYIQTLLEGLSVMMKTEHARLIGETPTPPGSGDENLGVVAKTTCAARSVCGSRCAPG